MAGVTGGKLLRKRAPKGAKKKENGEKSNPPLVDVVLCRSVAADCVCDLGIGDLGDWEDTCCGR